MTTPALEALSVRFVIALPDRTTLERPGQLVPRTQLSPQGLRAFVQDTIGLDAVVLHDTEILFGSTSPTVWLEALDARSVGVPTGLPPLVNARPWQQVGWFSQASAWLNHVVHVSGDEVLGSVQQVSTYDLACILHADTRQGGVYLKAGDHSREAAVTARLASVWPDLTVPVLAADLIQDWLITRTGGVRMDEVTDPSVWVRMTEQLAFFHGHVREGILLDLGCPVFTFENLVEQVEVLAGGGLLQKEWNQDEGAAAQLREVLPTLQKAHARVLSLGLPLTAAHGDAQPMNALVDQEQVRWFDFSEASVAHPLLDVGWLLAWVSLRKPSTLPILKEHPDLVEVLWTAYLDARGIKATETTWQDVRLLALAHRLVAYEARLRSWKGTVPDLRPYVPYYLQLLLKFAAV